MLRSVAWCCPTQSICSPQSQLGLLFQFQLCHQQCIGETNKARHGTLTNSRSCCLLQVVGFTHGYHALAVMSSGAKLAHGKRLAQVHGIRLSLRQPVASADGGPGQVFMQLDGEPWLQQVPAGSIIGGDLVSRKKGGGTAG